MLQLSLAMSDDNLHIILWQQQMLRWITYTTLAHFGSSINTKAGWSTTIITFQIRKQCPGPAVTAVVVSWMHNYWALVYWILSENQRHRSKNERWSPGRQWWLESTTSSRSPSQELSSTRLVSSWIRKRCLHFLSLCMVASSLLCHSSTVQHTCRRC